MMSCPECRMEIETALPQAALSAAAQTHAAGCAACHARQSARLSLAGLLAELEPVAAPPDFEFRLRARIVAARTRPRAWRARLGLAHPRALTLVLAACLVLTLGVLLRPQLWPPPPATTVTTTTASEVATNDPAPTNVSAPAPVPATTVRREEGATALASAAEARPEPRAAVLVEQPALLGQQPALRGPAATRDQRVASSLALVRPRAVPAPVLSGTDVDDLALGGAPMATNSEALWASLPAIAVPVPAQTGPLHVTYRDMQGAARELAIDPVSFGSRDLLSGRTQPAVLTTDSRGVW